MNRKTLWCALAAAIVTITTIGAIWHDTVKANEGMDYYAYAESLDLIEVVNSPDLTMEELAVRNGKLIIEQVVGKVTNAETGEGYIIGYPDYYMDYSMVKGIEDGSVVCSYMVYNPDSNYEDDILIRFDYVIDGGK